MRRTNVRQPCTPCRTQARSDDAVAAYELGGNSPGILNIRRPPYTQGEAHGPEDHSATGICAGVSLKRVDSIVTIVTLGRIS